MSDLIQWGVSLKSEDAIRKLNELQIKTQTTGRGFITFGTLGTANTKKVATAVTSLGADVIGLNGRMLQLARAFGPWGIAAATAIGVVTFAWKKLKDEEKAAKRVADDYLESLKNVSTYGQRMAIIQELQEVEDEIKSLQREQDLLANPPNYVFFFKGLLGGLSSVARETDALKLKQQGLLLQLDDTNDALAEQRQHLLGLVGISLSDKSFKTAVDKGTTEREARLNEAMEQYQRVRDQLKVDFETVYMNDLQREIYNIDQLKGISETQRNELKQWANSIDAINRSLEGQSKEQATISEWYQKTRTPMEQYLAALKEIEHLNQQNWFATLGPEGAEVMARAIKMIREEFEQSDPAISAFNNQITEFRNNLSEGMREAMTPLQQYNATVEEAHMLFVLNAIDLTEFWTAAEIANRQYQSQMELAAQRSRDAWVNALQTIQQTMYQTFGDSDIGKILGFLAGGAQIYVNTKTAINSGKGQQ